MLSLRTSIVVSAAIGIFLIVRGGFQPDGYLIHVLGIVDSPYPLRQVLYFCALLVVECLLLYALLTYPRGFAGVWRVLTAFALFAPWACLLLFGSMHQAPYYFAHMLWVVVVAVALLVNLGGTVVRHIFASARARRSSRV